MAVTTRLLPPAVSAENETIPARLQRRLTVEEYERMIEAGILGEDDRIELLEGVLVEMSPQGQPHARIIRLLIEVLVRSLPREFAVWPQLPVVLGGHSVPEPDVAVVPAAQAGSKDRLPHSAILVVEVSGESLSKDRRIKAPIYAAAGVRHYWIVNVDAQEVEVYGNPDAAGRRYRTLATLGRDGTLEAAGLPGVTIPVASLFD